MGSSLEQIELYIHCYCPLGLMEMGLATFFCPARVPHSAAGLASTCRELNMISSCDMRFLPWIKFSLSINISSCIINVIPIGDQKVHCCMHFLTIYNLNPHFVSFRVFCPDLQVDPCWFLSIPCQHKEICKRLALRQGAKTWTCIRGQPVYVRCGRVLPCCHLYQEHSPLPIHSSCLMSPCCQGLTCPRCCCSCRAPGGRRTPARPPPGHSPASHPPEATQPGPRSESRRCSRRLSE